MIAKFLSALICGSLILTSPGLGSYQSLAGGLRKAPAGKAAAVGVSPVLPPLLVFGRVQFPRLIQVDGGFVRPYNIVDDQIRYERIGLEEAQGLLEQGVEAVSFASPELLVKEKEALRVWVAQGQKTARQELEGVEAHLRQEGYGGILDMVASQGGTPQNSDRFAQLSAVAFDLNQREERPVYPQEVAPIQAGPQRRVEPALPDRSRVPQAGPQRRVEPALPDRSRVPQAGQRPSIQEARTRLDRYILVKHYGGWLKADFSVRVRNGSLVLWLGHEFSPRATRSGIRSEFDRLFGNKLLGFGKRGSGYSYWGYPLRVIVEDKISGKKEVFEAGKHGQRGASSWGMATVALAVILAGLAFVPSLFAAVAEGGGVAAGAATAGSALSQKGLIALVVSGTLGSAWFAWAISYFKPAGPDTKGSVGFGAAVGSLVVATVFFAFLGIPGGVMPFWTGVLGTLSVGALTSLFAIGAQTARQNKVKSFRAPFSLVAAATVGLVAFIYLTAPLGHSYVTGLVWSQLLLPFFSIPLVQISAVFLGLFVLYWAIKRLAFMAPSLLPAEVLAFSAVVLAKEGKITEMEGVLASLPKNKERVREVLAWSEGWYGLPSLPRLVEKTWKKIQEAVRKARTIAMESKLKEARAEVSSDVLANVSQVQQALAEARRQAGLLGQDISKKEKEIYRDLWGSRVWAALEEAEAYAKVRPEKAADFLEFARVTYQEKLRPLLAEVPWPIDYPASWFPQLIWRDNEKSPSSLEKVWAAKIEAKIVEIEKAIRDSKERNLKLTLPQVGEDPPSSFPVKVLD